MKKLLLCLLLLNFYTSKCQSLEWHEGSVVLASGSVLTGKISLDAFHDLLLLEQPDKRTVYPAHKIHSLYFYDEEDNINRRFISVREHDVVRDAYRFFEIVVQGEINVLRRQKMKGKRLDDVSGFTYHFQYKDELLGLKNFMRQVYPDLASPFDDRLKNFMHDNRLRANTYASVIRIVEFYDQLIRADEALAKQ